MTSSFIRFVTKPSTFMTLVKLLYERLKKMFIFLFLFSWSLAGVFGVDAVKSVSVTEGESVTLNPGDAETQTDMIMWSFGHNLIAKINRQSNTRDFPDGRFRDRLKLDQTGSLNITNTRTTDSGLYTVRTTKSETPLNTFNLTVYARLPDPRISMYFLQYSSLSSSSCSFVCSADNVSHVTLSWYKGNSVFSSMSVSDLSSLSELALHLECLDDSYSCVLNNSISKQTTDFNHTRPCRTCSVSVSQIVLISAAVAGSLMITAAAVGIFCIRKHRKTDREVQSRDEEITYKDPTFKRHKSSPAETEEVVYTQESRDVDQLLNYRAGEGFTCSM